MFCDDLKRCPIPPREGINILARIWAGSSAGVSSVLQPCLQWMHCPKLVVQELSTACLWTVHGLFASCPWAVHGLLVDCLWEICDISEGWPSAVRGLFKDTRRAIRRLSFRCPPSARRRFIGRSTGCQSAVRRLSVSNSWSTRRLSMAFPWTVCGVSMGLATDCP